MMRSFGTRGNETNSGTIFRDVIMLALAGFVAIVILILPHIKEQESKTDVASTEPPGNVMVEIRWADELDTDIDLWVEAPGDIPVGYSNKGGKIFNLLRDDLGKKADATDLNYEVVYSRGIPPGEYTVNVHLYRNSARVLPIEVKVVTSVKKSPAERARQILTSNVKLGHEGQELTVYRFRLDEQGNLVPNSVHALQRDLRTWRSS